MNVFHRRAEFLEWRKSLAPDRSVGFVPTMGALHRGHAELLHRCRAGADVSVLSIFVNPTQFGPKEDLASYPRTLERDLALAREFGVDAVYAPAPEEVYATGSSTWVEETAISAPLCGHFRPGHFRGVTTVVLKLFNLVRPDLAYFGLKDAQQFFVLARMVRDLDVPVKLVGVPTVREADGLALSSRNAYLSPAERATAPLLQRVLFETAEALEQTRGSPESTLERGRERLRAAGFDVQYLEAVQLPDFTHFDACRPGRAFLLAAAAKLGQTRLIDNVIIRPALLDI